MIEGFNKGGLHLTLKVGNDLKQVLARCGHIRNLRCHIVVALLDLFIFLNSVKVNVTNRTQTVFAACLQLYRCRTLLCYKQLEAQGKRVGAGHFVILPQLRGNLILLLTKALQCVFVFAVCTQQHFLLRHLIAQLFAHDCALLFNIHIARSQPCAALTQLFKHTIALGKGVAVCLLTAQLLCNTLVAALLGRLKLGNFQCQLLGTLH